MIEGLKKKVAEDAANAVTMGTNATKEGEQNPGDVEIGASGSVVGSLVDSLK